MDRRKCPVGGGILNGAEIHTQTNQINYNAGFTDMMLVKA